LLNSDMENGYLRISKRISKTNLRRIHLAKNKFSQGFRRQSQENYIMFKYFFIENFVVYYTVCKNEVVRDREHDYIIEHMRFACYYIRQFEYNLLSFHVNNIYTTLPPYHGATEHYV
jgi:hypothetical protein